MLNAGFQRSLDFTSPETVSLTSVTSELNTNYLSPVYTVTHFLSHLTSVGPSPASIILVSSGLALVPLPRCPNYCATKAAIHSLAWSLRAQLSSPSSPQTNHIRVVEIIPPAVQTELHPQQEDLVAKGQHRIGLLLEPYADETWNSLKSDEDLDEILSSVHAARLGHIDDTKKQVFDEMMAFMAKQGLTA